MLTQKYKSVLDLGLKLDIQNGDVKEENGVLKVSGKAKTPYEKDLIWDEIKRVGGNSPKDIQATISVANESCYHVHTVTKGESLWALADKYYKNGDKYPVIAEHNNTEHIHPGDVLEIPDLKMVIDGEKLQVMLTLLGYYTKNIDGDVGNITKTALKSFQSDKGLSATGNLDDQTKSALRQAFKSYTGGNFGGKALQILLRDAGCNPGAVDGIVGKKTHDALATFQSACGIAATGQLDNATIKQLINCYA